MESLSIIKELLGTFFPESLSRHFEVVKVEDTENRIDIYFEELEELVPVCMKEFSDVVLDGFTHPIELQSFPMKGKQVYLHIKRRRWKSSGSSKHFSNSYDLHPDGVKATHEFASFLKGSYGLSSNECLASWQHLWD